MSMFEFDLKRIYHKHYTGGEIIIPPLGVIKVLELPWLDNKIGKSCIKEGTYIVDRDTTGKHQWYRFRNEETDPRTDIEIHPTYYLSGLLGCLAPCFEIKATNTKNPIAYDSLKACELFKSYVKDSSFILNIMEA